MISAQSSVTFPFGDRQALVSIDSNCSRHMTGFYTLLNSRPSDVLVDGAFQDGMPGRATSSGILQLGRLFFRDAVHVRTGLSRLLGQMFSDHYLHHLTGTGIAWL